MVRRNAQCFEVVVVPFDFRSFNHLETHGLEGVKNVSQGLGNWVKPAVRQGWPGQRDVESLALCHSSYALLVETSTLPLIRGFKSQLNTVRLGAQTFSLVQREIAQTSQDARQLTLPAEIGKAPRLKLGRIAYHVKIPQSGVFDFGGRV